jgi:hypothetical protein
MFDAVPMFERWHWTMEDVDELEFDDFTLLADTVGEINKREAEARNNANRR